MEPQVYYLTSGYRLQRWPEIKEGFRRIAFFGIRGGYIGLLLYRDEDLEKIISVLSLVEIEQAQDEE